MDRKLRKRIREIIQEEVSIVPYNPKWQNLYLKEATFLRRKLPKSIVKRFEHFGSTAISGISAKPIIDILVEVSSLEEAKNEIVPILKSEGYEYFWRPTIGNKPPYYAWFIKRNFKGKRTHHIHMVEADSKLWDRLYFRDYLKEFPKEAKRYDNLKKVLSERYPKDRVKYTKGKTEFIVLVTKKAKKYYKAHRGQTI
jgi:GrpB-like predicted nucleotidyltransferase (UPF0157 family)